ncbi:MAG: hypothetical protein KKD39_06305, partial [Candidatus Altiarchaeota archaeon]|nr:hypothetical protein [Candidatus Altiarchaeota archaeon]
MKFSVSKKMLENTVDLLVFAFIYFFLLSIFKPTLLFSETITAGGDTASHYLPAKYLMDELIPSGRVIGWFPGWYAGMPLFQSYFLPPFLLMAFLGYIIGLPVAFKLVTVAGIFILPAAAYFCIRLLGYGFPAPSFAASLTLLFLFMENQSMWGGNIPSTLAGEFSYSISLSVTILFFGLFYKGVRDGRYLAANTLLAAFIALTHAYTILWVVLTVPALSYTNSIFEMRKRLTYSAKVFFCAFLISGFWVIPLLARNGYTTAYAFRWYMSEEWFQPILWPAAAIAALAVVIGLIRRDERVISLTWAAASAAVLFHLAYDIDLVDIRFIPFIYVTSTLLASTGLYLISRLFRGVWLFAFIVVLSSIFWASNSNALILRAEEGYVFQKTEVIPRLMAWNYTGYIPFWIQWNYEGFENKGLWNQYSQVNTFLKGKVSDPRVKFEHSNLHDSAGSVRAFENIPLFSGKSIIEGLYIHASSTAPFAFYLQSEVSEQRSCPFFNKYPCTRFNLDDGTKHLKLFNTQYIVARSDRLKDALSENPEWVKVFEAYPFDVWELTTNRNAYVYVPDYMPKIYSGGDWKHAAYDWFKDAGNTDKPVIFEDSPGQDIFEVFEGENMSALLASDWINIGGRCNVSENISSEKIYFTTDCVGLPHIISISYYPSWTVYGAQKIYLVSPSFMLVVPQQ